MPAQTIDISQVLAAFADIQDVISSVSHQLAENCKVMNTKTSTVEKTKTTSAKTKPETKRGRPAKASGEKKESNRKCPNTPAKELDIGESMIGNDGFVWIVAQRPNSGHLYWKAAYILEENDTTIAAAEKPKKIIQKKPKRGRPAKDEGEKKPVAPRKCPEESAKNFDIGTTKPGLDGREWTVTARPNSGALYWKAPVAEKPKKDEAPKKRGRPKKVDLSKLEHDSAQAVKAFIKAKTTKEPVAPAKEKKVKAPRKCPEQKAKDAGVGSIATGADGNNWIVAERPNSGHLYWKKN